MVVVQVKEIHLIAYMLFDGSFQTAGLVAVADCWYHRPGNAKLCHQVDVCSCML